MVYAVKGAAQAAPCSWAEVVEANGEHRPITVTLALSILAGITVAVIVADRLPPKR